MYGKVNKEVKFLPKAWSRFVNKEKKLMPKAWVHPQLV